MEFWTRSVHFGQMGAGTSPTESEFFFVWETTQPFGNFATADFHQIWSRNVVRCPVAESGDVFKTFHFRGHLPPKSKIGQTSTLLRAGYRSRDALQRYWYCLLHVVVQEPGSFQGQVNFSLRCTVAVAKPIIQRALRQSHVNGATTLKLYGYIGIGKYLGLCQKFSVRGRLGVQGPLM